MTIQKKNWRKIWLDVHLYIGLTIGLIFAILGLTGSINVFQYEIDELLHPDLVVHKQAQGPQSLDAILASVQTAYPGRDGAWRFVLGRDSTSTIRIDYEKVEPGTNKAIRLDVDPYTGKTIRTIVWGDTLVTWIYKLHLSLLAGEPGYKVIGVMGVVMLVSSLSGLYLWWPRNGKFRRSLTIKRGASRERLIFDLHQVGGIYSLVLLIILAVSGINYVYPRYLGAVVNVASPVQDRGLLGVEQKFKSAPAGGRQRISITEAVAAGHRIFPGADIKTVRTPSGADGVYEIRYRQAGELLNKNWSHSMVWLDQYSGAPVHVRNPENFSAGESFMSILGALHSGEAAGMTGRILIFVSGLLLAGLYVTGVMRWLDKRKAKKFRGARVRSSTKAAA